MDTEVKELTDAEIDKRLEGLRDLLTEANVPSRIVDHHLEVHHPTDGRWLGAYYYPSDTPDDQLSISCSRAQKEIYDLTNLPEDAAWPVIYATWMSWNGE